MVKSVVQLLMVLAIFNPFCCCTATTFFTPDDTNISGVSSCCSVQQTAESGPNSDTGSDHDPENCFHKALKDYEASTDQHQLADPKDSLLLTIESILDSGVCKVAVEASRLKFAGSLYRPTRAALLQEYCVYRI